MVGDQKAGVYHAPSSELKDLNTLCKEIPKAKYVIFATKDGLAKKDEYFFEKLIMKTFQVTKKDIVVFAFPGQKVSSFGISSKGLIGL